MAGQRDQYPDTTILKHDLGGTGYAMLTITVWNGRVTADFGSTRDFPPNPYEVEVKDVKAGVELLEKKFAQEFPDHVCTDKCLRHWQRLPNPNESKAETVN